VEIWQNSHVRNLRAYVEGYFVTLAIAENNVCPHFPQARSRVCPFGARKHSVQCAFQISRRLAPHNTAGGQRATENMPQPRSGVENLAIVAMDETCQDRLPKRYAPTRVGAWTRPWTPCPCQSTADERPTAFSGICPRRPCGNLAGSPRLALAAQIAQGLCRNSHQ